jgi:hypothetical protein
MYGYGSVQFFVTNPIKRFSIGDRTEGLTNNEPNAIIFRGKMAHIIEPFLFKILYRFSNRNIPHQIIHRTPPTGKVNI